MDEMTAFAPATVGNACVGYDILGFALDAPGDEVTVRRIDEPEVRIDDITGVVTDLPSRPEENTATASLIAMRRALGLEFGFEVSLKKGIPLGSGMGGSAASAVGAVVAAEAVIDEELSDGQRLDFSLSGESVASGARHADNAAPCLFGGLVLTRSVEPLDVVSIPVPEEIRCAVAYPNIRVDTRRARSVIPDEMPLSRYVDQSKHLAGFVSGCHSGDVELIARSMRDVLVEPHRAELIPGFDAVRKAAEEAGSLAASISGAGPSVFAWCPGGVDATRIAGAMAEAFDGAGCVADTWTGPVADEGARVLRSEDGK